MRKYTRLSDSGSLNDGALPDFSPPFATEYELDPTTRWGKVIYFLLLIDAPFTQTMQRLLPGLHRFSHQSAVLTLMLALQLQLKEWWRVKIMGEPQEPVPPSGYMTLIPLNGALI